MRMDSELTGILRGLMVHMAFPQQNMRERAIVRLHLGLLMQFPVVELPLRNYGHGCKTCFSELRKYFVVGSLSE